MLTKAIAKNLNLLNVILIAGLLFFLQFSLIPRLTAKATYTPPNVKKNGEEKKEEVPPQVPSPFEYTIIADQNVFHPERKIPPDKKDAAQAPIPVPEFALYGTLITDDATIAYLEDLKAPQNTPGRGKRQTALRKGDSMSGFTLKEVEPDRIVMARGEEKMTVYLNDPQKPKKREAPAQTATGTLPGVPATAHPPAVAPVQRPTGAPAVKPTAVAPQPQPVTQGQQPLTIEQQEAQQKSQEAAESARRAFTDFFRGARK